MVLPTHAMWLIIAQRILIDIVVDILYFPLWWYTKGLIHVSRVSWNWVRFVNSHFAPALWLKNVFVPMFGQTDWEGRVVSFFVRLGNVMIRSLFLLCSLVLIFFTYLLWPLVPIIVFGFLVLSFS